MQNKSDPVKAQRGEVATRVEKSLGEVCWQIWGIYSDFELKLHRNSTLNSKFHFELKFHNKVMLKYPKNSTKSPIPGALTLGYLKVVAFYSPAPAKSNCPPKPHQNCPNLLNSPQNGNSQHIHPQPAPRSFPAPQKGAGIQWDQG